MLLVYSYEVTLRRLGFILEAGDDRLMGLKETLAEWADSLTEEDLNAHVKLVQQFDDDDWEGAGLCAKQLDEYSNGN